MAAVGYGDLVSYDKVIANVKLVLGQRRIFKHVRVLRRGMAFCIDAYVVKLFYSHGDLSARFLCLHGTKDHLSVIKKYGPKCFHSAKHCGSSLHDCAEKNTVTDEDLMTDMRSFSPERLGLGGVNDISDCWPHCPPEIPGPVWETLKNGLSIYSQPETG